MKTNLEFLVDLIGKARAEQVLQDYVKKSWKHEEEFVTKPVKPKQRKRILGSQDWKPEENEKFVTRVQELQTQGASITKIGNIMAREFTRTPSAIMNHIYNLKLNHVKA